MSWKKSTWWYFVQSLQYGGIAGIAPRWAYKKRWEESLAPGRNSVADEQAWLNFPALDFLEHHLTRAHRVFEYGGGGSTLFFLRRVAFVATVENDPEWFEVITQKIQQHRWSERWQGFLQPGEPVSSQSLRRAPDRPEDFMSHAPGEAHLLYEKYVKTIEHFPADYFDVILIDGRARPSCIAIAPQYLKRGGWLVVDNMERTYYQPALQQISPLFDTIQTGRFPVPYHPDFTDTRIMRKR